MSYSNSLLSYTWRGTDDYFLKAFRIFRQKSQQEKQIISVLQERLPSAMEETIYKSLSANQKINILSVGSGDGKMDIEIVKIVHQELNKIPKLRDTKIFIRAVEPNRFYNQLYQKELEKLPEELRTKTKFDIRANTFEEYIDRDDGKLQFNLVTFIHSIYFFDVDKTFNYVTQTALQPNGQILFLLEGSDITTDVYAVSVTQGIVPYPRDPYHEVLKSSAKRSMNCLEFRQTLPIDVTDIFNENSEEGSLLLDFCSQTKDFRKTADRQHADRVLSIINRKAIEKDGKRFGDKIDILLVVARATITGPTRVHKD